MKGWNLNTYSKTVIPFGLSNELSLSSSGEIRRASFMKGVSCVAAFIVDELLFGKWKKDSVLLKGLT